MTLTRSSCAFIYLFSSRVNRIQDLHTPHFLFIFPSFPTSSEKQEEKPTEKETKTRSKSLNFSLISSQFSSPSLLLPLRIPQLSITVIKALKGKKMKKHPPQFLLSPPSPTSTGRLYIYFLPELNMSPEVEYEVDMKIEPADRSVPGCRLKAK